MRNSGSGSNVFQSKDNPPYQGGIKGGVSHFASKRPASIPLFPRSAMEYFERMLCFRFLRCSRAARGEMSRSGVLGREMLFPIVRTEKKGSHRRIRSSAVYGWLPLILITIVFITTTGCEESLDPMLENDRYFYSVNGYLDASADTQWVRVMPVRESIYPAADISVPRVILEDKASGESVIMQDSLIQFEDDRQVLNFWTTMKVHPGRSYHLTVEGAEGKTSYAETTLPEDFPSPFFSQPEFNADILIVQGVERLADIRVVYRIRFHNSGIIFEVDYPHLQKGLQVESSRHRIPIEAGALRARLTESYCNFSVLERNIFVASGGPGWPDFVSLDRQTIALPDYLSNIENGVGFFGGIISKTFPYIDVEGDDGLFDVTC